MKYLIAIMLALFVAPAYASNTIIVPVAPGGPMDIVARKLLEYIPDARIEYVTGGAGNIGMIRHVQRERSLLLVSELIENNKTRVPDGYPWNIMEVSRRVLLLDGAYYAIFVNSNIPFGSRDPIVLGIAAPGSGSHAATTGLCEILKNCLLVPYPSAGRMIPDVMRGELHGMVTLYTLASGIVSQSTNIRIHAILGPARDGIPSFSGYSHKSWFVLLAKGYSDAEIRHLRSLIKLNPKDVGFDTISLED